MSVDDRAQGSLEFMMTYGWAVLVILLVTVVMWQWGLFSIGETVEPGSFGFWGVTIQDGKEFILHQEGRIEISLLNTVGANVTVITCNVTVKEKRVDCEPCSDDTLTKPDEAKTPDCVIPSGESRILTLSNSGWGGSSGKKFEAKLVVVYNDTRTGEAAYQSSGNIWGNYEV